MKISFIAAMSQNRVIGNQGMLPWHLPNDLQHFKKLTLGKYILMGRKTFDSLKRPLPNRYNCVLTNNHDFKGNHVQVFFSKAEILESNLEELIVIGGEQLFKLFLPECEKIYLTLVHAVVAGDTYFPEFKGFIKKSQEDFDGDDVHQYKYSFIEYIRASH